MASSSTPLFDRSLTFDPGTLTGALFYHCRAVEEVLLASGHVPGVGYVGLDVIKVATTLMTASEDANGPFKRWILPEPDREESFARSRAELEDDLPF